MSDVNPLFTINPGPIIGAGSRGTILDVGAPLPNVMGTLRGWFQPMVIGIVTTVISKGSPVERVNEIQTSGLLQPGDPERLKLLPEGNRSWKNYMLHVLPGLPVQNNDTIKIKGVSYTVMASTDYDDYGFVMFELVEGYRAA